MRIVLAFIVLSFMSPSVFAQEQTSRISVSDSTLQAAILKIEAQTEYKFFFIEDWLKDKSISISLTDTDLETALERLLQDTELNYYLDEEKKQVFLLKNSIVYDQLPKTFFGRDSIAQQENITQTGPRNQRVYFDEDFKTISKERLPAIRIGRSVTTDTRDSYTLNGKAINAKTNLPIENLVISINGSNRVVVSDKDGNYNLKLPAGINTLSARAIGLRPYERDVIMYNDGSLNIIMQEGLELLDEVVVDADALKNVEEAVTGTEEINTEETKDIPLVLGERNLLQVAQTLPGITSAGEGTSGINVRGGKSDQNLILLDEAVVYNPTHFFGIFQALNPFTTESIKIYKAAPPLEYGGRLSSVMDIETKDGNSNKIAGEASIGPVTSNIALEIPVKKDTSSLVIGGRAAYANWILRSLDEESLNRSEASFYDGIVKYHHKFTRDSKLSTSLYYSKDNFSITSDSLYGYSNFAFSSNWSHRLSDNTLAELALSNSDYGFNIDFEKNSPRDFELKYGINETQLRYKLRTRLNARHVLNYGLATKYYSVNPGSEEPLGENSDVRQTQIEREQGLEVAVFIGDEFKVSDRLLLTLGARFSVFSSLGPGEQNTYDDQSPRNESSVVETTEYNSGEFIKTYGGPEARFSARYLFTPDFSIKASINNAYQFLHTLSNNTTVSPIDTWKISDLNIRPQKVYQGSLGLFKNFNDNMFELSVEGFYKLFDDVLDFKTGASLFLNENVATEVLQGDGKSYGVEFLLKKEKGDLNGWLSYTYSRAFYRFDGDFEEERINNGDFFPANFDKPHVANLIANYKFTRRYSFSMNFTYQTGRPITFPIGTYRFNNADFVLYSDRNKFRIPDYYRLDLGINIEGNHKKKKLAHSFVTLQVYNVLGRNNPYSVFFVTDDGEIKALQSSIFAIPIPSITYNIKF